MLDVLHRLPLTRIIPQVIYKHTVNYEARSGSANSEPSSVAKKRLDWFCSLLIYYGCPKVRISIVTSMTVNQFQIIGLYITEEYYLGSSISLLIRCSWYSEFSCNMQYFPKIVFTVEVCFLHNLYTYIVVYICTYRTI